MCHRLRLSPLEPRATELYHNTAALLWADYCAHEVEEDQWDRLGCILGTHWTRESVGGLFGRANPRKRLDEVTIPLAFIIQPGVQDMLKNMFGKPSHMGATGVNPEDVVELWDVSREQFARMAGGSTRFIPKIAQVAGSKK